eukprot:c27906_g3_i1 orf=846-2414(+)
MSTGSFMNDELSKKTSIFGLRIWVVIGIGVGAFIVLILFFLSIWLTSRKKSRRTLEKLPSVVIPPVPKEIKEVKVDRVQNANPPVSPEFPVYASENSGERDVQKDVVHVGYGYTPKHNFHVEKASPDLGRGASVQKERGPLVQKERGSARERHSVWREEARADKANRVNSPVDKVIIEGERRGLLGVTIPDKASNASRDSRSAPDKGSSTSRDSRSAESIGPSTVLVSTLPEVSHLGWGHWYTLRELELATGYFSDANVIGEGGYGIVYQGQLVDGTRIAVKNLLNNRGQAEKEFRVEVEIIGRVRHKNLVRLLGYCAEGSYRMLVYEYVDNGNLDQWLHESLGDKESIPWDTRMKLILGTAKGLAYLHEGLEPKVVHRDVKASNILLDSQWNAKVSDFGLAKLLGSEKSHVTTRVMGTFGYVAPEYASTGLLNERSDVYSFGVLLMETITGRDPVDYSRPAGEVNLVDWLKMMVSCRRSEEVADPKMRVKPSPRALKRALLVALRCVDPDSNKRPKMGHVV